MQSTLRYLTLGTYLPLKSRWFLVCFIDQAIKVRAAEKGLQYHLESRQHASSHPVIVTRISNAESGIVSGTNQLCQPIHQMMQL